jgi:hypothetical protein
VNAGGTLVVFPSLPGGSLFTKLFALLGTATTVAGDSDVVFNDGTKGTILGSKTVLSPSDPSVRVFARDSTGGAVGARFAAGKGQVLFFGGDISRWSAPPGTVLSFEEGGATSEEKDYPEDVQRAGRATLAALLKEARVERKSYPEMKATAPREPGLYTTELIADAGSLPFERRAAKDNGYAFAGVTNFSAEQTYAADLVLTDPRAPDLASSSPDRYLHIPRVQLPPRESLMLPIRVPLDHPYLDLGPGLEGDELLYATAEVNQIRFDKTGLHFALTAPSDGEIALRLRKRPASARLDGQPVSIREDARTHSFVITIAKGEAPHFIRALDVAYATRAPAVEFDTHGTWIAGSSHTVGLKVTNNGPSPIAVKLGPSKSVVVAPGSNKHISRAVTASQRMPNGSTFDLTVHLREQKRGGRSWNQKLPVVVHDAFEYSVTSPGGSTFPLREDQPVPLEHPLLVSLNLPREAVVRVRLKNWLDRQQKISLTTEQSGLELTPASASVKLAPGAEQTIELRAKPLQGSGLYRVVLKLHGEGLEAVERAFIAAVAPHESLAYAFDFDRDGFDDAILENQQVRLFVSPRAGGRSFGFVLKSTNHNAFDSIGGLHDTFTTRFEPADLEGLPDWTRANWLGLYNRPYIFRIPKANGPNAIVQLAYEAPDIYPKGVKLTRTLTLNGDQDVVVAEYRITPFAVDKPQAFVLENSVPFRSFDQPSYSKWFLSGEPLQDFVAESKPLVPSDSRYFATRNSKTGETLAIMPLTAPKTLELITGKNAASFRTIYPDFDRAGGGYSYRIAFYLGMGTPEEIDAQFKRLQASSADRPPVDGTAVGTAP